MDERLDYLIGERIGEVLNEAESRRKKSAAAPIRFSMAPPHSARRASTGCRPEAFTAG